MALTLGRLAGVTAALVGLLIALILGALSWNGFHAAEDAAQQGASDAASTFRLISVFLLVTLVFLVVLIGLVTAHVVALVRVPLQEMRATLERMRGGTLRERVLPHGPQEVRALARSINNMAADLEHERTQVERTVAIGTIDALIDGIAHEIHTPLTSLKIGEHLIKRHAEVLQERADLPDDVRDQNVKVLRYHERNRAAIGRLETFSRALREVVRRDAGPRDPNLIMTAAVAITHHRMPKGTRVITDLAATKPIEGSTSGLFHAVHELLLNAAEAVTDEDTIVISTRDEEEGVVLGIRDTGPGIAPEVLELLGSGGAPGDSLTSGLFLSKRAIESIGGTMRCRTAEGDGTAWTVHLPRRATGGPSGGSAPV